MTMGFYVPTNKDVKFPKACEQCYFYDGLLCCVLDTYIYDPENKHVECPLIEVSPHGDLIDRDELKERLEYVAGLEWNQRVGASPGIECAIDMLDDAQTVIPADVPDNNVGNIPAEEGDG